MDRPSVTRRTTLLASPWRTFVHDELRLSDGRESHYAYAEVPAAVFVVAITTDDEMLFVRQYRHPLGEVTTEVPAGALDADEDPETAAKRELAEETGATGGTWVALRPFASSSAHLTLRGHPFLAMGVAIAWQQRLDAEEHDLSLVRVPSAEGFAMARDGRLVDGQTALAVLLAELHIRG